MAYRYYYEHGEANFGRPLKTERRGGTHLTFEVVLHDGEELLALRRPNGLHDGPKNALYFPHGLIRFGETVDVCAQRLAQDHAGIGVSSPYLYTLPSWVDNEHWHMCLNLLAKPTGQLRPPSDVSEVVVIRPNSIPDDFGWWTTEQIEAIFAYLKRLG